MKELGEAINESLSEAEPIAAVIAKIKEEGYDVFLVLEATVGFNKREDQQPEPAQVQSSSRQASSTAVEFALNAQDLRFLRSLRITADEKPSKPKAA
jgi:hypothetical protein